MDIQPSDMRTVTMRAEQWQQVLVALHQAPYGIARPLIDTIVQQCTQTYEGTNAYSSRRDEQFGTG